MESHLWCAESTYRQFNSAADSREPTDNRIPPDFTDPGPNRPLFGAPTSGTGIAQLDPAVNWPDEWWNWQSNVNAGVARFHTKIHESDGSVSQTRTTLRKQFREILKTIKTNAGLNPNAALPGGDPEPLSVPDLSKDQRTKDAIRRYNSGKQYQFDGKYVLGADGRSIHFIGSGQWIVFQDGWNQPDYVHDVMTCAAAGAPLNLTDPAKDQPSNTDRTIFTLAAPGGPAHATGTGFQPGETVVATLHSKPVRLGTTHANKTGAAHIRVRIPTRVHPGHHRIVLLGRTSHHRVTIQISVMRIVRRVVAPGHRVHLFETGFRAGERVHASLHPKPIPLGTKHANKRGAVHITVRIPTRVHPGHHRILLRGHVSGHRVTIKITVLQRRHSN